MNEFSLSKFLLLVYFTKLRKKNGTEAFFTIKKTMEPKEVMDSASTSKCKWCSLLPHYCRKYDVNVLQARSRKKDYTAMKWKSVIGEIDDVWCWEWAP